MKTSALLVGAIAQLASAHYFFDTVIVNGSPARPFQYVRDFTRPTKYNPIKFSSNPAADIRDGSFVDGPDIRCNQGAFSAAGRTDVLTVQAGTAVTVRLGVGATMQHPGPSLAYLSRAPGDDVKSYDGSGDWFKIFEEGVCNQGGDFTTDAWCSWDKNTITATIPADTPDGEYLFRAEHIGIHRSHVGQPEHYVSCVQIKVEGGGSGNPSPLVKFPGAYAASDEYANFSIYGGFKNFPFPGPAVWSSGGSGGSAPPPAEVPPTQTSAAPVNPPAETSIAPVNPPAQTTAAPVPAPAPTDADSCASTPRRRSRRARRSRVRHAH